MTTLDTDQIAALVRAYGTPAEQRALFLQIRVYNGQLCPECGAGEIDDNGCGGSDLEFRCRACDHRWEPSSVHFTTPAAAPVEDECFDVDKMFPAPRPRTSSRRHPESRIAHSTNRRGW